MGGKNKKHKAPGAAAVRAAVSASRAKSAEAAALGEAQNKKSVARPPPAAAASTREPRVKQGPKIYSFNSANDSGGPANLDKSILKVVINHKLEQRIIGVINEHKKQNNDKGVISGRLTAKKLQDLYMALQAFSFKTKDIEDAMTNTLLQGGDLHSALDWLCLNLSDDALPEGFSQEFEEQQPKSRPKFQSPQTPATVSPPLQPKTKTPEDTKIKPKKEEKNLEVNMKEWILRYAEQQNEEEKSENSKSLEEEEKFDPNERYLHLAAKLLDAKEQAATFKLEKNKQGQKEAQEKIRKFQREKKKEPHDVRNFDYTARSWTGKSPKQFLIDWVRKNLPKSPNPSFEKVPVGRYWKCRVKVIKSEDDVLVACPTILTEDGMQAQHLGATLALYHLVKGQSVHQLLPPTYRDVWLEWSDAEKKKEALNKMETNKPRDVFVAKLLNRLKQQQQQQQQQQRSGNKRGNSEDPEESWENLVSDEDFSALSLDAEKAEDLEPARTLFRRLQSTPKYQRLLKERQQLPVFKHRNSIVETLKRHRVVVVAGETGSGKSTQVPHFLLEDLLLNEWGTSKCNIVCTQPRRISAVSLATRVCDELGCENGPGGRNSLCGYQIRMESRASESTRLLYCTTGVLLRKLQEDGLLTNVSHVIVDEVHERSVQSDFLLIILKEILRKRSDLHLILMSATVDSEKFSTYFTHCPILRISGRSYPVEVFHLEDIIEETGFVLEKDSEYCQKFLEEEEEITINVTSKAGGIKYQEYIPVHTGSSADLNPFYQKYSNRTQHAILYMNPHKINLDLILELLIYLDRSPQFRNIEGAVLIFLPGLAHIQQLYDLLSTDRRFFSERYKVIALHSILSTQDQAAAFTVPPPGVRKIVLATNIAETGITIPDVVFVIDTGRTKENKYHESSQMSSLVETSVSKASALQRQGRAGRVRDGFCFRMYTRERFEGFMDYSVPEILRVPLEELCLHIMKCNLGSPEDFLSKALDPPQLQVISNAMNLLRKIGACELNEPTLTPLGQHLAALPVNVKIGKMLIFGAIFGCLDPVATLAAVMTEKSPFTTPIGRKDEADLAKSALAMADSDHLTIYNAYLGWKKARQEGGYRSEIAYCRRNFLNRTSLLTLEDVKQELIKLVKAAGFSSSTTSNDWEGNRASQTLSFQEIALLKAVLVAGLYDNVGKIIYTKSVDVTEKLACIVETAQGKAQVHPSSVNRDLQTYGWLLYQEKVRYTRVYLRETTLISPFPVLLFGGDIEVQHRERLLSIDGWISFQAPVKIAVIFKQLRVLIDSVLRKKLENPKRSLENDKILQIITELIKTENHN
ncbi:ATP-dependent RNA helicase DHX29 isoform X3 [Mirounga angustirostris]|uniref:ATP-dependent RNA helicase DHX29 isoform X3 n=1 Tax=Mirounga angustirostris TaxID=9716 RepID=UPI001E68E6D0|nr:ATP-dependent RNA helicase DHX29 isoform X2 [Mirounga angustirostris]